MAERITCPYSTHQIIEVCIKLGEKMGDVQLRPYQTPFAYRIVESLLKADGETITGLFSRQCVDVDTLVPTVNEYGVFPKRLGNLTSSDFVECLDMDGQKVASTGVVGYENIVKQCFEMKFHTGNSLFASYDHRVKMSTGKWKGVGEVRSGEEVVGVFRALKDYKPDESYVKHEAKCFYFAQALLHKGRSSRFNIHTASEKMEKFLGLSFFRDAGGFSYPVEMDEMSLFKIFSHGFVNPYTVLKHLLEDSILESYRNNRKYVPRIRIKASSKVYSEFVRYFFTHYGMACKETEYGYEITQFETLQRLQRFYEGKPFYEELRDFCSSYYCRIGNSFSRYGFTHVLRQYPGIKRWIKPSLLSYYAANGIKVGNLLQYLRNIGIYEDQVDFPTYCFVPVKDVIEVPMRELRDIETTTGQWLCENVVQHNSGKTETVAVVCDAIMVLFPYLYQRFPDDPRLQKFSKGVLIGIFAPSADQSKTTFDRMRGRLDSPTGRAILGEYGLRFTTNRGDTVSITNGSLTRSQTASKDANIESKTYHLIILEEAQDIFPYKIKKSILPMLTATNGSCVMVGTANTQINELYSNIRINKKLHAGGGPRNHFEYDWKEVCRYAPDYKKSVQKAIVRMGGEDSDEFRMSYCNEFIFERGMAFTEDQLSHRTANNPKGIYIPKLKIAKGYSGTNVVSCGIDVGKARDSTVLTAVEIFFDKPIIAQGYVAYFKRVLAWCEMLGDNYDDQISVMVDFLNRYSVTTCWMDVTGKGEPVYDMLNAMVGDDIDMNPFVFSTKSKHLLYTNFLHDVNGGRFTAPGDESAMATIPWTKFDFQMRTLVKEYNGNFLVCKKPDSKIDGQDPHDDFPDSAALACYAGREEFLYDIDEQENPFFGGSQVDERSILYH